MNGRLRVRLAALLAVAGPGVLAGLSDDDPGGITTYAILGTDHGYRLLWVLAVATGMLVLFHAVAVRLGAVTGQGITGLVRERYGVRAAAGVLLALVVANVGTTCAEYAGIAAALDLAGVPRALTVPVAAVAVAGLVAYGRFARVEHVLLAISAILAAYIAAGIAAGPDWGAAARGLVVPTLTLGDAAVLAITATIGTTIAPWGLAFIQSYAVDKRMRPDDLGYERVDVVVGAVMTGVIGFFVVVACAATLHASGASIDDAGDAARALEPFAGAWATRLFGVGLLAAGLLAAAVVPLSTAYSVAEAMGVEARVDDRPRDDRLFYGVFLAVTVVAATLVVIPATPLVAVLYLSQAANAILLVPLLVAMLRLAADRDLMGRHASPRWLTVTGAACVGLLGLSVGALALSSVT